MVLLTQLESLVREANDPWLTLYVINHLGDGVPVQSIYASTIQLHRAKMYQTLLFMLWRPEESRDQSIQMRLKRALSGDTRNGQLFQPVRQRALVLAQQRALLAARAFKMQFNAKLVREFRQSLQAAAKDPAESIAAKLHGKQPLTRLVAALVAGRKRLHVETALIDRLSDPYPQVREAARKALIRLSRGNDFGPLPKTTAKQVARSIRAWRAWYNLQDPPETVPEYLAPPQLAEADHPPVWERLPRPQPAKAEVAQH